MPYLRKFSVKPAFIAALSYASISACSGPSVSPQSLFMSHLKSLCGQSFSGDVISTDAQDDEWRVQAITMHVRDCEDDVVRIPLHVGENRSRTWVITHNNDSLTLKHIHRHDDGSLDAVTNYGGTTSDSGTPNMQSFPIDQESIDLFQEEGLSASITNVWTLSIIPNDSLIYGLARENRDFRIKFDLTQPIPTPPPAWGAE